MPDSVFLPERVAFYSEIEKEYVAGLEKHGVTFASKRSDENARAELIKSLARQGALVRNGGASISINRLSSACVACTGDCGSKTFTLSLQCNRDCYFCFNPNQINYSEQLQGLNDWLSELESCRALGVPLSHIALTGGEPLLHKEETLEFFTSVRIRYPSAHTRLYTSGDNLDTPLLKGLAKTGLTEIRFSIKMDDDADSIAHTLRKIALAQEYIPQVMVEMPVIPGTSQAMHDLLDTLNELGIFGINLLEFCFPRHNWSEFEKRGFEIKNPPFSVLYDYLYAGGLPIAESEELALELLSYALKQDMTLGVHYCSLENKHRDEIYQLNMPYASAFEMYQLDQEDFFLKTVIAFGKHADQLRPALTQAGIPFEEDFEDGAVQFNPKHLERVFDLNLDLKLYCSYNIVVPRENEVAIRELKLTELTRRHHRTQKQSAPDTRD